MSKNPDPRLVELLHLMVVNTATKLISDLDKSIKRIDKVLGMEGDSKCQEK